MKRRLQLTIYLIAAAASVFFSVAEGISFINERNSPVIGKNVRIVIDLLSIKQTNVLTAGLNYELLKKYAETKQDSTVSIVLAKEGASYPDSLKEGAVDILAMPCSDTLIDGISFSRPVEGTVVWAIKSDYKKDLMEMNAWLDMHLSSEEYSMRRELFLSRFNPQKRAAVPTQTAVLSPYDDLIKEYAERIGWDWRLLAAIIYSESKFHIEACSHRNAIGLMQLKARTAERFGAVNLLDPEENIKAGTAFIQRLQRSFREKAPDRNELDKYVIAAYNAGEGRIKDCISFAEFNGIHSGKWEDISAVIPQMRDSSALETGILQHGTFKGEETIRYVDHVLAIFDSFKTICKE